MKDSADGEGFSGAADTEQGGSPRGPSRPPPSPSRPPTEEAWFTPRDEDSHPATEAGCPPPTEEVAWDRTATVTAGPRAGDPPVPGPGRSPDARRPAAGSRAPAEVRFGPGVPAATPASQGTLSADEVWRTGRLPKQPGPRGRWRRRSAAALTAALLAACGAVIYLRLQHAPLTVTGVAITSQVKNGCAVNVTGRISTSGGAGTVSYQWVLAPQVTAPHPLSQSVTAGQSAVYVTVSDQGTGHGQQAQQVTLQVLGPEPRRASTHVVISC